MLAKTSHSVYEEVARVMQLPTLSYILRKNKEIVGEQGVSGYYGVHITHISSMSNELISILHNRICGVNSYDVMKKRGYRLGLQLFKNTWFRPIIEF